MLDGRRTSRTTTAARSRSPAAPHRRRDGDVLADNYFGYCKKEVKTQIGYSANLFGMAEEEHAGGALAFSDLQPGRPLRPRRRCDRSANHRLRRSARAARRAREVSSTRATRPTRSIPRSTTCRRTWRSTSTARTSSGRAKARSSTSSCCPAGSTSTRAATRSGMAKHPAAPSWRLIGTVPEGTFCHKPCTVSGGGKSRDQQEPASTPCCPARSTSGASKTTWTLVQAIFDRDYDDAACPSSRRDERGPSRPILSPDRSLGSVIKLLTPNPAEFTPRVQRLAREHPRTMFARSCSSSSASTGRSGATIGAATSASTSSTARPDTSSSTTAGGWSPATSASAARRTAPGGRTSSGRTSSPPTRCRWRTTSPPRWSSPPPAVGLPGEYDGHPSLKLAQNCEFRLFQRPDDAIHPRPRPADRGRHGRAGLFCSNFQPLDRGRRAAHRRGRRDPRRLHRSRCASTWPGTPPRAGDGYSICSAQPRLIDGKPSKNPRYLQVRPDLRAPARPLRRGDGRAAVRRLPLHAAGPLPGDQRALGPPEQSRPEARHPPALRLQPDPLPGAARALHGLRLLADRQRPQHHRRRLAKARSPRARSTPCAATADLNNALVSMLLTGYGGFSSAAGFIGPRYRVDHDISLLIPEIWCRLFPHERDPKRLIEAGHLEKLEDFELDGKTGARQPARLPHHRQVRAHVLRAGVRQPRPRSSPRKSSSPNAGSGGLRRRRQQHRRGAAARGGGILRGRHDRGRVPPAQGAAAHHGARGLRGQRRPPSRHSRSLYARSAARERLVSGATCASSRSGTWPLGAPRREA